MKMSELVLVSQGGRAAQVSDFQDKPVFRQYFCSDLNQALTPTKMEITLNHNQFSKNEFNKCTFVRGKSFFIPRFEFEFK